MRRTAYLGLSLALMMFVLVIAPAPAIFGQAPAMKSKAEYDAYNAAYTEKGPAKKAELSETFLNNFKDSDVSFRTNAYIMMVKGYADAQNFPKSMETASKVTEVVPNMAPDNRRRSTRSAWTPPLSPTIFPKSSNSATRYWRSFLKTRTP